MLLTGLTLWSLGGYYWNDRYYKADVGAAASYLEESNSGDDPILVPVVTSVFKYYHQGSADVLGTYGFPALGSAPEAAEFCDLVLADKSRCWLVLGREWFFDPEGYLPMAMSRRGHLRLVSTAAGVQVYGWEKQSTGDGEP